MANHVCKTIQPHSGEEKKKRAPFHLLEQKHKRLILPNTGKNEEKGVLLIEQYWKCTLEPIWRAT